LAALYGRHTGREALPTTPAREAWLVVGRRGGKSRIATLVAVWLACFRDYRAILAPGERGTVMLLAADRRQARTVFRYVEELLDGIPLLRSLVERRTREGIYLRNRVIIEVHTASFRAVRGYTVVACIADEVAFWRSDESANPDVEILNGLRPGMATVPGALLLCIS
jgi:phage terminase large subunit-like protein